MFGYKTVLDAFKALFINIFTLFIQFIPREVSRWVASFLGVSAFILLRNRRRAIMGVMKVIEPEMDNSRILRLACRTLINYGRSFSDFLRLFHMNGEELMGITEAHGLEYLRNILTENRGLILLTAHIGNWEVGSNFIAGCGFPLVGVAESAGPGDRFYRLFQRYREHFGMITITLEDPAVVFKLRKYLKRGYIIGLLGDRDIAGTGVEVTFIGRKSIFPQGPAFLSLITDCPVVPAFFLQNDKKSGKQYYAVVEKPIEFERGKDRRADVRRLTQLIAKRIERIVREYPDQYFSFPPPWEVAKGSRQK
jgi:KDO2-lipid IV(A) lauroyltransferase